MEEKKNKKKYIKPDIITDEIYETRALGCGQCLNYLPDPETALGESAGCQSGTYTGY